MSSTPSPGDRRSDAGLLVVGTAPALRRAARVRKAHAAVRPVRAMIAAAGDPAWRRSLTGIRAVILLTDPALPVADAIEGTHVLDGARPVPVGVLPDDPRAFAAAASVQRRDAAGSVPPAGSVVLLSSRDDHVVARVRRLRAELETGGIAVCDLPSRRVDRAGLLAALAAGPGLVIYSGEGSPRGWSGYGRVQSWEFDRADAAPMGAVVSLSCCGSARRGSVHGLSEVLVERGLAASALGAVADVRRDDDEALGLQIADRLAHGARCLADALPSPVSALREFRISGDPLAPFAGAPGAETALALVDAPAVGDPLPAAAWA